MSFTYCLIFAAGILVTSPHVPVYVGNYGVSVQGQLGLEGGVSGGQNGADRTYVEDLKDPNEVQLPGGDGFFVIFCMGKLGEQIPFLLLDDLYLDFCHSSAIDGVVSEAHIMYIIGRAYVVSCLIASHTDRFSSSNLLPPIPRSRAPHTSAQVSPSSTHSSLLAMVSWIHMSLGDLVAAEEGETYPDHCEEGTDGTENSLGWGDN